MAVAYTSPSALKSRMGITDTNADAECTAIATAVNDFIEDYIGFPAGSAGTAARTYDGDGSDELFIRGGVQGITTLEIASETGGTWTTLAATEYVLRPFSYERPTGWPGWRVRLTDKAVTYGVFTPGYGTVRITPSGGWDFAATPEMLKRIADIAGVRMFQARQSGETLAIGSTDFGAAIVRFLPEPEYMAYLDKLRYTLGGARRLS